MAKSNKTKKLQQQWKENGEFVYGKYDNVPQHSYSLNGMTGLLYAKLIEDVKSPAMNATINLDGSINKDAYTTPKLTKSQIYYNAKELAKITKISLYKNQDTKALNDEDLMQIFK